METRSLGKTGLAVTTLGFGAFKIGRNRAIKYPQGYSLPDEPAAERLLNAVLDLGIGYIDTAPAYGLSEERIGRALAHRRSEFVLSTKVGETFTEGRSTYDFSAGSVRESLQRSRERLRTDVLDLVYVHSDGRDLTILTETDVVETLQKAKQAGEVRAIGFSGKTVDGARHAIGWADALMVEYHASDVSHETVMAEASDAGLGVVVKKGLASGHLPAERAIPFVLENPHVDSLVIGGLNREHLHANVVTATRTRSEASASGGLNV